jgi:hypothetical protein
MVNRWIFGTAVAVLAVQAQVALAAPTMEECRALQDAQARLACYDSMSAPAPVAPAAAAAAVEANKEKNFGLAERQKAPEERSEPEQVQAKISSISGSRVVLDNGQEWQVTTDRNLFDRLRVGQTATIKRGVMSGYRIYVDGVTGMETVRRIQ